MKVIGFVGSPRKGGNTEVLVKEVLNGAAAAGADTAIFYLNEMNFKGCQACGYCKSNDHCVLDDDLKPVYDEIRQADAVVIGSPVYMGRPTGLTYSFVDRWYAFLGPDRTKRLKDGKKVVVIYPQGNPDQELFRANLDSFTTFLKYFFGSPGVVQIIAAGLRERGAVSDELLSRAGKAGRELL